MSNLEQGWRSTGLVIEGEPHDVDKHGIAVDFPFDRMDTYRTDWAPGVWDKHLATYNPPMVAWHNPELLIGATVRSENLRDRQRMIGRFSDFDAVPLAKQIHAQTLAKEIPGWSYHYAQARSIPHPNVRGALRYVQADMREWGPTTMPSIPGVVVAGIRSEGGPMSASFESLVLARNGGEITEQGFRSLVEELYPEMVAHLAPAGYRKATVQSLPHGAGSSLYNEPSNPSDGHGKDPSEQSNELNGRNPGSPSIDAILALKDAGHIDDDGVHALVKQHYPHLAEHWKRKPPSSPEDVRSDLVKLYGEEAVRSAGIDISMPKVGNAVSGGSHDEADDDNDDDAAKELVAAINASLEASEQLADEDEEKRSDTFVPNVIAYLQAAHCAAIELADIMGVQVGHRADDVDEGKWDGDAANYTDEQYRSAALVAGKNKEDSHLPVKTPEGKLSRKGVHAAAAALAGARGGVKIPDEEKRSAARKLIGHYNTLGEKPPPSVLKIAGKSDDEGGRSDEGEPIEIDAVEALLSRVEKKAAAGV